MLCRPGDIWPHNASTTTLRSAALFLPTAIAEIRGAWPIRQGLREHRGPLFIGAGIPALGGYGFVATFQPDSTSGALSRPMEGLRRRLPLGEWSSTDSTRIATAYSALWAVFWGAITMYAPRCPC